MNLSTNPSREEAEKEISRLSDLLRKYQYQYYILARPEVSDGEYDRLFDELAGLEERFPDLRRDDSPTSRVGSDLASDLPEVSHSIPVLSLDKVYGVPELTAWINKIHSQIHRDISFVAEEKIDGVSIVLYYRRGSLRQAVTRGNGYTGNDVTANVKTIGSIPLRLSRPVDLAVRGEIYLPKDRFEAINRTMETPYANPRNLAAGTIRRIKSSEAARVPLEAFFYEGYFDYLSGGPAGNGPAQEAFTEGNIAGGGGTELPGDHREVLEELAALGFRLNPRTRLFAAEPAARVSAGAAAEADAGPGTGTDAGGPFRIETHGLENIEEFVRREIREREELNYEIDGLVFKINELPPREELGYTGHHPRWAMAYKFESPQGQTVIRDITVQVGRTGRITPVARVEPVAIGGSTISNVTLHNQEYIQMLELALGDTVTVSKRGDVIPAVEAVIEKNEDHNPGWTMPEACPACKTPLVLRGAHHFCPNPDCPDQIRGRLIFFAGKGQMDIENLGPETLETLISLGMVRDVQDIYTMDPGRLEGQPGFGEKKIRLIREGIEKSLARPFKTVLASLGIPELGPRGAELLVDGGFRTMEDLMAAAAAGDPEAFTRIDGIGEVMADIIIREFTDPAVKKRISGLEKAGLSLRAPEGEVSLEEPVFAGQSWCVTGSFEHFKPRELALEEIKKRGGKAVSAVSPKTTHLLAGEGAGSKLAKARELGVRVVTEEEFLEMLRGTAHE